MDILARIETLLVETLERAAYPSRLGQAMHHAVFSGGSRLRPQLCMAVAAACGAPQSQAAYVMAAAVELVHCASLVHDDLPCFDNASLRRGRPTVHRQFGEPLAVLAGDGLIMAAHALMQQLPDSCYRILQSELASAGQRLVAGQGWEAEDIIDFDIYHTAKTGALFEAATVGGAYAAGVDGEVWRGLGQLLGRVYQLADDLADCTEDTNQPNVAQRDGALRAHEQLGDLLLAAKRAVPAAPQHQALDGWFASLAARLEV